jgi:N-acetyltransferase 10
MVRGLNSSQEGELEWLAEFTKGVYRCTLVSGFSVLTVLCATADFCRHFLLLLSYKFCELGSVMALSVIEAANNGLKLLDKVTKRGNAPIAPHHT